VDDVYKFQQMESDDVRSGAVPEHDYHPASASKNMDPDQLYFNDMDIQAWERRTSALNDTPYAPEHGYLEDEGYCEDTGEALSPAEYEEMLFQRVLDKIRLARAAGIPDVQLSQEEIDAYQSKLHGTRSLTLRSQAKSRSGNTPVLNDVTSIAGKSTSSRSKKSQQRSSLFASKPKKEKPSGRKRTVSNAPSPGPAAPPGFVIPGPDGRPIYTPINASQDSMARDPVYPTQNVPRTPPNNSHEFPVPFHPDPPREMPGAFPGSFPNYPQAHQPVASTRRGYQTPNREPSPRMMPFPVEPYQYHAFSQSSSSQSSPQPQYNRRVSSAESSHTARTELPEEAFGDDLLVDIAPQFDSSNTKTQTGKSGSKPGSVSGGRRDEEKERKRKSARSKKKH
jgi:hypothetical protein